MTASRGPLQAARPRPLRTARRPPTASIVPGPGGLVCTCVRAAQNLRGASRSCSVAPNLQHQPFTYGSSTGEKSKGAAPENRAGVSGWGSTGVAGAGEASAAAAGAAAGEAAAGDAAGFGAGFALLTITTKVCVEEEASAFGFCSVCIWNSDSTGPSVKDKFGEGRRWRRARLPVLVRGRDGRGSSTNLALSDAVLGERLAFLQDLAAVDHLVRSQSRRD